MEAYMTRKTTVTKKASPTAIAENLNRVLSTRILLEYSNEALRSSEVAISIIAMKASHKLRSENVRGMFISVTFEQFSRLQLLFWHRRRY